MQSLTSTKNKNKSLAKLVATIIALLAFVGLLNQSIAAFFTFNFYFLFGAATPLFFVAVFISVLVYIRRISLKNNRFYLLMGALFISCLLVASLFYQAGFPTSDFTIFNNSITLLGNHLSFYQNPNLIYSQLHGGYLGGLLYSSLYSIAGRVFALIIISLFLVAALVLVFWPFINLVISSINDKVKTYRHRNKVIRDARRVPSSQTISPLKTKDNPTDVIEESTSFFSAHLENKTVKRAIFGEESSQEPISFNPVIVNINSISRDEEDEIDAELLEAQVETQNEQIQATVATNTTINEQQMPISEQQTANEVEQPSEEDGFDREQSLVQRLLRQAEIEENLKAPELTVPTFQQKEVKHVEDISLFTENDQLDMPLSQVEIEEEESQESSKVDSEQEVSKTSVSKSLTHYEYPNLDLLNTARVADEMEINRRAAEDKLDIINSSFANFRIGASAISYTIGPSITRFDIKMDDDKSVSTLTKFIPDIGIRLGGLKGRFEPIIIGKSTSGYEVPNEKKIMVTLKDCLQQMPSDEKHKFAIPFGKNIDGKVILGRVDEFPHLLVAGSTGSGKSVFVHSLLITLLMRNRPDELKLLIIDPKRVEMTKYRDIPHLLCPIIKEAKEARIAMEKLADEMERRYRLFEEEGANKLSEYNALARELNKEILPRIIVIVDEYADVIESEKDISSPLLRLAQKSRAAGINLIVATQRPSVEIITGTIKANLPARVALLTASTTDSLVILGQGGAESLLGNGDMLVDWAQVSNQGLTRIQGAYVDNGEIRAVTDYLKNNYPTDYMKEFLDLSERHDTNSIAGTPSDFVDSIYEDVKNFVYTQDTISINRIQTTFGVTFNRAKPIYDMLMAEGIIVPPDASNSSRGAKVIHQAPLSRDEMTIENNDY